MENAESLLKIQESQLLSTFFKNATGLEANAVLRDETLKLFFKNYIHFSEYRMREKFYLEKLRIAYVSEELKKQGIIFKRVIAFRDGTEGIPARNEAPVFFKEPSLANFENKATGSLGVLFEKMREAIKNNLKKEGR